MCHNSNPLPISCIQDILFTTATINDIATRTVMKLAGHYVATYRIDEHCSPTQKNHSTRNLFAPSPVPAPARAPSQTKSQNRLACTHCQTQQEATMEALRRQLQHRHAATPGVAPPKVSSPRVGSRTARLKLPLNAVSTSAGTLGSLVRIYSKAE